MAVKNVFFSTDNCLFDSLHIILYSNDLFKMVHIYYILLKFCSSVTLNNDIRPDIDLLHFYIYNMAAQLREKGQKYWINQFLSGVSNTLS